MFYVRYGKRAFDILGATAGLLLLGPLLLLVAIAVRLHFGRPVLFRQLRPGIGASLFTIYKFRTMRNAADRTGRVLPDEERLTKFGRWLRSTSLDELPELCNVLLGQMSLVGPRPLLIAYLPRYSKLQARRHEVRPGITGWAQVNGRNSLTWEEKFALDVWYVDHASFGLDLQILLKTIRQTLLRSGINQPGHATAQEFMGTSQQ